MQILDLPNELVAWIAECLDDEYCINALVPTCRRFFWLLNRSLYKFNVRYSHACALEWAAKHSYEATARYALEAGASPNAVHYEEWVPMALACIYGHDAIYESERVDSGCPMILAAGRGHENVIRLLLSSGASPDIRYAQVGGRCISPLSRAAKQGHLSVVKLLVSLGCDVHIEDWYRSNIIASAADGGHCGVVRFLLETNLEIESRQMPSASLKAAAEEGHLEIVELLLEYGMTPTPTMEDSPQDSPLDPLIMAAQSEHYAVVETLQKSMDLEGFIARGKPDDDDHKQLFLDKNFAWSIEVMHLEGENHWVDEPSPLYLAARRGHHGVVDLLLNYTHSCGNKMLLEKESTALLLAIQGSHKQIVTVETPEIFQLLLDRGADPGINADFDESVFVRALRTGSQATVDILARRMAFKEPLCTEGSSPLSFLVAAALGGTSMIEYLLESDYPVEPGSREVRKALRVILSRSDTASLTLLFERGLVGNLITVNNNDWITWVGSPSEDWCAVAATLDILMAHGVEVEVGSKSPLIHFVLYKNANLVQLLLDRGAYPLRVCGNVSRSPLEEAAGEGYKTLVSVMLKSLDRQNIPLEKLQCRLVQAERLAELGEPDDIIPLLRRFYWRKRYQDMPTP
ncbi:uncharacterized protein N7482_008702 [Penicillium canariense]|uniref:Ankyrin repeat-containing domain protein n=1 Tax=Penicillium canariense TaxID=189055 RepID=A0A9W9LJ03_9EURO|nr:uncharacterized protein N7482_008702 [Penicillium canariense]KAJ5157602.1 hypothetical protein N7482_008702 [Penicillium canariense]